MKKEMVKALSLGLTAATIAGSLDVPVIAAENIDGAAGGDTNITITTPTEAEKEAKVAADTDQLADDFFGDYRPVEEAEEPEGNPVENPVEEKKDDAEEGEELDDAELLNTASVTIAGQQETNTTVDDATEEADSVVQAVADVGNEVSALIDPDVANPHTEIDAETAAEYQQILDSIDEDVDLAGEAILDAVDDTKALQAAGQAIDTAAGACTTAANAANTAAGEAESAADGAEQKTAAAITAVEKEEKEVAAQIIIEAGETLEQAKETYKEKAKTYNEKKAEYDKKKEEYDNKYEEYKTALTDTKADLVDAQEELDYLEEDLNSLLAELEVCEQELLSSAAGVLAKADTDYKNGDIDAKEYVAKIVEFKYVQDLLASKGIVLKDGQRLEVEVTEVSENADEKLNLVSATYKIVEGEGDDETVVSEDSLNLGFEVEGDAIKFYNKTKMYDYTVEAYGHTTTITFTQGEMDYLERLGSVVKRYAVTQEDGTIKYKLASELEDDEKNAPFEYVFLLEHTITRSDVADSFTNESSDDGLVTTSERKVFEPGLYNQKYKLAYFDEEGNYVEVWTVKNGSVQTITTKVNGQTATVCWDDNRRAQSIAESDLKSELGLSSLDGYTVTVDGQAWALTGYYVPRYSQKLEDVVGRSGYYKSNSKENNRDMNKYAKANYSTNLDAAKDTFIGTGAYYNVDYVVIAGDVVIKNDGPSPHKKFYGEKTGKVTAYYDNAKVEKLTFNREEVIEEIKQEYAKLGYIYYWITEEDILDQAIKDYCDANKSLYVGYDCRTGNISTVAYTEVDSTKEYNSYAEAYAEYAKYTDGRPGEDGVGEDISRCDFNTVNIARNVKYSYTHTETKCDDYDVAYTEQTHAYDAVLRNIGWSVFNTNNCSYVAEISKTNAKIADYAALKAKITTAQGKVTAAQTKVDDILEQIENLNRTKENWDIELLGSWNAAFSNAQQNLEDAEDALERAQQNLDKAKDDYNKKYPAPIVNPNPGPNDENRDYPLPQPAELEDMATILPAPEVPLGGQTTTTRRARRAANTEDTIELAEAEIPLAGDTTEPETKEDEQPVATIEDDVTPLAGGESGNFLQNAWWWLLLILIAAVGGTTAYVKKVKKSDNTLK